jgi:hypothetical protein
VKVVSGEDAETLDRVADAYGGHHPGGRAPRDSPIKVAEGRRRSSRTRSAISTSR